MPHLQGISRETVLMFPPSLDEYIAPDNPVRFMDAFVDQLDLRALGFQRAGAVQRSSSVQRTGAGDGLRAE